MPTPLGQITITTGAPISVAVGTAQTVGAVVIANESPYGLMASNGAGGVWIPALTVDRLDCASSAFNGNITLTAANYLNFSGAPSSVALLTTYAPGEAIPGVYPASLTRITNVSGTVTTSSVSMLQNDGAAPGTGIIEATPSGSSNSAVTVNNSGGMTLRAAQPDLTMLVTALPTSDTNIVSLTYPLGVTTALGISLYLRSDGSGGLRGGPAGSGYVHFYAVSTGWQIDEGLIVLGTLIVTAPPTLQTGHQETAECAIAGTLGAGAFLGMWVSFKTVMSTVPTSITLTTTSSSNLLATPTVNIITKNGFFLQIQINAAGYGAWHGTYTTVGN